MTTKTREATPEEKLQAIHDKIVQIQQRIAAINQDYQAARLKPDTHLMQQLIVEATALQDALPVLQCQAVAAEIEVLANQRADAERRREELRAPMVETDAIYRRAEQTAGAALTAFRLAEEEEKTLSVRINNVRLQLGEMERAAAQQSWRP